MLWIQFGGDACESNLKSCKRAEIGTGNEPQFRRTACGDRGKKTASKSANENELRWKKASHCIDAFLHVRMHDTTSSAASGTHAYLVKAPRKVLQLRNKPAFQRAN